MEKLRPNMSDVWTELCKSRNALNASNVLLIYTCLGTVNFSCQSHVLPVPMLHCHGQLHTSSFNTGSSATLLFKLLFSSLSNISFYQYIT
jgi:hypothetical protein